MAKKNIVQTAVGILNEIRALLDTPLKSDVVATGFSGGLKVMTTTLGKVDRVNLDLTTLRGLISPGGAITITALSDNSSSITSGITLKSRV